MLNPLARIGFADWSAQVQPCRPPQVHTPLTRYFFSPIRVYLSNSSANKHVSYLRHPEVRTERKRGKVFEEGKMLCLLCLSTS